LIRDSIALQRYRERHTETGLPAHKFSESQWQQVLVLPAYREPSTLLQNLRQLPPGPDRSLVILVLNRPDSDPDPQANNELRMAIEEQVLQKREKESIPLGHLNNHVDLYLHDMEAQCGPTPMAQGVGLARKTGCDLALQWMTTGAISGQWICSIDADAIAPKNYFEQLDRAEQDAVAAVFPFRHVAGEEKTCDAATALYELRLHHHVLGLEYAGSPYAYHTLGSCLAVRATSYAQVRGFPKRAGAEDFYLLNKLAKLGPIARLQGSCIKIQSRPSSRVPFGTGPAVQSILTADNPGEAPIFYHPHCYEALRALLNGIPELALAPKQNISKLLAKNGLAAPLAEHSSQTLTTLGLESALAHCQRQSTSKEQFLRQFHQWFDAFLTLKFIHAIRDTGWPQQSVEQLDTLQPCLWPKAQSAHQTNEGLREDIARHWGWQK
jgi:hypothetical protein